MKITQLRNTSISKQVINVKLYNSRPVLYLTLAVTLKALIWLAHLDVVVVHSEPEPQTPATDSSTTDDASLYRAATVGVTVLLALVIVFIVVVVVWLWRRRWIMPCAGNE